MPSAGITGVPFAQQFELVPTLSALVFCEVGMMLAASVINRLTDNLADNPAPVVENEPSRCDESDSMIEAGSAMSFNCAFDIPTRCGMPFSLWTSRSFRSTERRAFVGFVNYQGRANRYVCCRAFRVFTTDDSPFIARTVLGSTHVSRAMLLLLVKSSVLVWLFNHTRNQLTDSTSGSIAPALSVQLRYFRNT